MTAFNLLDYPLAFARPQRLAFSAWIEHTPFAMFLVNLIKPGLVVELGTHYGVSYCAYCQAVNALQLPARCFAIDNWEGDTHAGYYGDEVYESLRAYHDPLYAHFSSLMRTSFDEALSHFDDNSIDLLHIDGCHHYDAIRHDFEKWLPKMSARGVILLHDTQVREQEFGVWQFWEEICPLYAAFEFLHASGLGILSLSGELPFYQHESAMRALFEQLGSAARAAYNLILHEEQIADYERSIAHNSAYIGQTHAEIEHLNAGLDQLTRDSAHNADYINQLHMEIEHLNAGLDQLTRDNTHNADYINQLHAEIERKNEDLAHNADYIGQLHAEIERKNEDLAHNAEYINQLHAEIERKNEGFIENTAFITSLEAEIERKRQGILQNTAYIATLEAEIGAKQEMIALLQDELAKPAWRRLIGQ
jgi:O-antigen biosynthesis protein